MHICMSYDALVTDLDDFLPDEALESFCPGADGARVQACLTFTHLLPSDTKFSLQ